MPFTRPPRRRHVPRSATSEPLEPRKLLSAGPLSPLAASPVDVFGVAVAAQADGKLVVAGYQATNNGDFVVARYNADGTVDTTFGDGGRVATDFDGADDRTKGVGVLPDGRIVVAGESYKQGDGSLYAAARYNPNGSLDNTFDGDGKVRRAGIDPFSMAVGPDGKIVFAGSPHSWFDGLAVLRLNPDGSPDASFGDGGLAVVNPGAATLSAHLTDVAVLNDGKVVFGGSRMAMPPPFSHIAPPIFGVVGRLAADGTRDGIMAYREFGEYRDIYDLAPGPEGTVFAGVDQDFHVRVGRLNSDLLPDGNFGPQGGVSFNVPGEGNSTSLTQTADGKVLVTLAYSEGPSGPYRGYVARLTFTGAFDPTFGGGDGLVSPAAWADLVVQPSGRIVLAGTGTFDTRKDILLVALTRAGEPDPNFHFGQPARIARAWVGSSDWSPAFREFLAANDPASSASYGQALAVAGGSGAATPSPATPLPWINLNQVTLRFDGPAAVGRDDLHVGGVSVPAYAVSDFRYDPATATAVWTLAAPIGADNVTLEVDPAKLAGAQPLRLQVLPGDVDGDGVVLAADFSAVKRSFFRSTAAPGTGDDAYSPLRDVNGSGIILADDFSEVKRRFFTALPAGDAVAPTAPSIAAQRKASEPVTVNLLGGS